MKIMIYLNHFNLFYSYMLKIFKKIITLLKLSVDIKQRK